jgi:predicted nuclease with TOPRIM domain
MLQQHDDLGGRGSNVVGTLFPPDVIKALKSEHELNTIAGQVWVRAADRHGVSHVPILQGTTKLAMRSSEDFVKVVRIVPGEQLMEPLEERQAGWKPR